MFDVCIGFITKVKIPSIRIEQIKGLEHYTDRYSRMLQQVLRVFNDEK